MALVTLYSGLIRKRQELVQAFQQTIRHFASGFYVLATSTINMAMLRRNCSPASVRLT